MLVGVLAIGFIGGAAVGWLANNAVSGVSGIFNFRSVNTQKNTATIELVSPKDKSRKAPLELPLDKDFRLEINGYELTSTCVRPGLISVVMKNKEGIGVGNMNIDASTNGMVQLS